MPNVESHAPGNFCWVELATSDQGAAKKFYQALFGWGVDDQPMGPGETYTLFKKNGRDVAAGYSQRPEQKGVPPELAGLRADGERRRRRGQGEGARRPGRASSVRRVRRRPHGRPAGSDRRGLRRVGSAAEHRARRDRRAGRLLLGRAHGQGPPPLRDLLQVALRLGHEGRPSLHRVDARRPLDRRHDPDPEGLGQRAAALARLLPGRRLRRVRREGKEPGSEGHDGPAGLPRRRTRSLSSATRRARPSTSSS